jgi:hypothetical protein
VLIVVEMHFRQLEFAAALHVHVLGAIDEYVRDGVIGEQLLERTVTQHLVLNTAHDELPLSHAQRRGGIDDQPHRNLANLGSRLRLLHRAQHRQIEHLQQLVMNALLPLKLERRQRSDLVVAGGDGIGDAGALFESGRVHY